MESSKPKLLVSNLCERVQPRHLATLFSEVGPVSSISMHYDGLGNPIGSAEVKMENRNHAMNVVRDYHGASLDGYTMDIVLLEERNPVSYSSNSPPHYRQSRVSPIPSPKHQIPPEEPEVHRNIQPSTVRLISKSFVPKENIVIQVDNDRKKGNKGKFSSKRVKSKATPDKRKREDKPTIETKFSKKQKTQEELDAELNNYFKE